MATTIAKVCVVLQSAAFAAADFLVTDIGCTDIRCSSKSVDEGAFLQLRERTEKPFWKWWRPRVWGNRAKHVSQYAAHAGHRDTYASHYAKHYRYHSQPKPTPIHPTSPAPPAPAPTPYLSCEQAEPQAPRDVTPGYVGGKVPKLHPLQGFEVGNLVQANFHFHLGAEHYREGEYDLAMPDYFKRKLEQAEDGEDVIPGNWCSMAGHEDELEEYNFRYCKNVHVGGTYEFHWVFSTGADGPLQDEVSEGVELGIADGLGGAFAHTNNANVIVRAQVCRIVNNALRDDYDDFIHTWKTPRHAVRYCGSTTGESYNDTVCSPIEISWHVDLNCCTLSAQALDRTCEEMKEQDMVLDLKPHGSRRTVAWQNAAAEVYPL